MRMTTYGFHVDVGIRARIKDELPDGAAAAPAGKGALASLSANDGCHSTRVVNMRSRLFIRKLVRFKVQFA